MRPTRPRRAALVVLAALLALLAPVAPASADDALPAPVITLSPGQDNPTTTTHVWFTITYPVVPELPKPYPLGYSGTAGRYAFSVVVDEDDPRVHLVSVQPRGEGTLSVWLPSGSWSADGVPGPGAESEVVIIDRTGPTFPVFEDIGVSVPEGQTSMSVSWDDTAVDPHGVAWSECVPASGSTFSLGLHRVTCSAEDLAGNRTTERFFVSLEPAGRHSTALTGPIDMEDPTASPSTVFLAQPTNVIDDIAVNVVLTHGHLADVDLLLVGPEDKAVMLLSDVGCGVSVDGLGLRFEQDAPSLPAGGPIPSGIYAPTNLDQDCGESSDTFPAPAPGSWGTTLDIFRGTLAFGAFRLYVVDDTAGVTGEVERWSLSVRTSAMVPPALDELDDLTVEVGEFFSLPLGLEGNPEPTVTIDGDLPEGVTLTDGVLEGTPTETGNFPLTITASNGFGEITRSFVLSVLETASITSAASATAAVGTPFTHTFAARGFPTPELTVTADDLPEGLSLADGVLSGTPAQTGTFTVSVAAENEHSRDTQTFELTVRDAPAAPSIALETGQSEYTRDATVQLAVVFAEEPAGLSISDFELSGTATRGAASLSGSGLRYTVTVELASDGTVSLALPDGAWQNAEGHLGLGATSTTVTLDRVAPGLGALETLVVQLPEGASTITVDYPLPTVTDSSPTDLTCEPAPGTPLAEGVHPIECSATDAAGNTTVATAHILVLPAGDGTVGGVGDSIDVPDNAVASPYPAIISIDAPGRVVTDVDVYLRIRHSFAADLDILLEAPDGRAVMLMSDVGCDSSGTWDLRIDQHAEQHLPAGSPLASGRYKPTNLDPDGCGTGTDAIPDGLTSVTDSLDGLVGAYAHGDWKLWVVDDSLSHDGAIEHWALTISTEPAQAPTLTGPARVEVRVGSGLAQPLTLSGAPAPEVAVTSGTLPDGVELVDGVLEGTPTVPGEYQVTFTASNGVGTPATHEMTLFVYESPTFTTPAAITAAVGSPLDVPITATGFPAPTVTVDASALPAGVRFEDGALAGTPGEVGTFMVEVRASNGFPPDGVQHLALTVVEAPAAPVIELAEGQAPVTNAQPIDFTITFATEPVGFDAGDVEVVGTAGGGTLSLTGGPLVWTASVTGLDGDGTVALRIPFGAWTDARGFLGEGASGPEVRLDTVAPVLEGPVVGGPLVVSTDPGQPGAIVDFDVAVTGGTALGARLLLAAHDDGSVTCVPASGSFFPIGSTDVECSSTDEAGNTGTLSFEVLVVDEEAPVIADVDDVTVQLAKGEKSTQVDFEPPSASDNSGQVEVTCDPAPGTALGAGEHRVTCTAQDPSGNTATSSFTVTVLAAEAPEEEARGDDGTEDDATEEDRDEGDVKDRLPVTGVLLIVPAGLALLLLATGAILATLRRREVA